MKEIAPDQYPVGAEQAGITYQSAGTFILTNVIEVVLATLGPFLPAAVRSDSTKFALRMTSALAILGFTVLRIATIE